MTDRPIMFSAPMVHALLAGTKTQTRRLATSPLRRAEPGDRLWVRESFRLPNSFDGDSPCGAWCRVRRPYTPNVFYEAGGKVKAAGANEGVPGKLRPSIHMPRWASRLTLHVEAVRVEPLQAINDSDARAEGVELESADPPFWWVPSLPTELVYADPYGAEEETPRDCYRRLWEHLHGAGSWQANPDVLVLSFKVAA